MEVNPLSTVAASVVCFVVYFCFCVAQDLNFVPLTFVLPHDLRLLKREWVSGDQARQKWILKPVRAEKTDHSNPLL